LKNIQKEAVLAIQADMNPRLLYALLNSYTGITIKEDEMNLPAPRLPRESGFLGIRPHCE
jgi:hypothetical protein